MKTGNDQEVHSDPSTVSGGRRILTWVLIAVNVAVFLISKAFDSDSENLIGEIRQRLMIGVDWGPSTLSGQWWRLLSSTFVHWGFGHLFGNMVALYVCGKRVERIMGRSMCLFVYISAGVAASLTSIALRPEAFSAGASGSIFGLIGVLVAYHGINGLSLRDARSWVKFSFITAYVIWAFYDNANDPTINDAAHGGGLVAGLFLGIFLLAPVHPKKYQRVVVASVLASLLLGAIAIHHFRSDFAPLASGFDALEKARYDDCIRIVSPVLEKHPNSSLARMALAEAFVGKEDYVQGETTVKYVLASDEHNPWAAYQLGTIYSRTGRAQQAIDICDEYSQLKRSSSAFRQTCAEAAEGIGRYEDAAEGYLAERKFDNAIRAYEKALARKPDDAKLQLALEAAKQRKSAMTSVAPPVPVGTLK